MAQRDGATVDGQWRAISKNVAVGQFLQICTRLPSTGEVDDFKLLRELEAF